MFCSEQWLITLFFSQERQKRQIDDNAFSNDINKCLFRAWTSASDNPNAVLSKPVECKGVRGSAAQLCYGLNPPTAQFAVCYNKNTLTPDFNRTHRRTQYKWWWKRIRLESRQGKIW